MSRVVFIGGFASGYANINVVAEGLGRYYQDVATFTFSEAVRRPELVRKAVKGVDVKTHSASLQLLRGTSPASIGAWNAPWPTPARELAGRRTLIKTARMHTPAIGIQVIEDAAAVLRFDASCLGELVCHPKANFGQLGQIALCDGLEIAIAATANDIRTDLTFTTGDEYFPWTPAHIDRAAQASIPVSELPGIHDEVMIRTGQFLKNYFESPKSI